MVPYNDKRRFHIQRLHGTFLAHHLPSFSLPFQLFRAASHSSKTVPIPRKLRQNFSYKMGTAAKKQIGFPVQTKNTSANRTHLK